MNEQTLISEAVADWIVYCRKFTRKNQSRYRLVIIRFVGSLPDNIETINQLTYENIEDYLKSIIGKYTPKTTEKYQTCLRTFYHWIARKYVIKDVIPDVWPKSKSIPALIAADGTNVCENWFLYIQGLSIGTQGFYKRYIRDFLEYISKKYVNEITQMDILSYRNKILEKNKKSSVNNALNAIKALWRYLSEAYHIPDISKDIKNLKVDMPYQPFITEEQYIKVLEKATQRESDIIKMLTNLGLRASELCGLRPENVESDLLSMRIQGKGHKIRTIPCNKIVREILSQNGNFPNNRKSVYNACRSAGKRVGVHLAPHMLRRYFASQLINKGVSLLIVSRLLGHSSVQTTEMYLKLDASYLMGATDILE